MTNEERDLISKFVARVGGAASGGFTSVPATQPALPPVDREADQYIADQFQSHPEARYRITQMAVVQEAALAEAANRIQRLQWELEQAQKAAHENAQAAQQQPAPQPHGGFLSGLFGGGQASQPASQGPWNQGQGAPYQPAYAPQGFQTSSPPPQPQYASSMQPGMFQQGGSGFLGSALRTAAGVAGGVVAGNALMGLFSGGSGGGFGGGFGGGGFGGGMGGGMMPPSETIINNYGDAGGGGGAPEFDQNVSYDSPQDSGGGFDNSGGGFDNSGGSDSGGGGSFDDNSG